MRVADREVSTTSYRGSPSTGSQLYRQPKQRQPSTGNQLYKQAKHRQPVILAAQAQATSYRSNTSTGNQL